MLKCSISGKVPSEPVVTRQGVVYERRLIEKYIDTHQCCPVTRDALSREDLITIRCSSSSSSSTTASAVAMLDLGVLANTNMSFAAAEGNSALCAVSGATRPTVPTLVDQLQSEWDGLMLEHFTLRQQLVQTQHELALALAKHEAACRVVAGLKKECDALRETRGGADSTTAAAAVVLPATVVDVIDATWKRGREERKRSASSSSAHGNNNNNSAEETAVLSYTKRLQLKGLFLTTTTTTMTRKKGEGEEESSSRSGNSHYVSAAGKIWPYTAVGVVSEPPASSSSSSLPTLVLGGADGCLYLASGEQGAEGEEEAFSPVVAGAGHTAAIHHILTLPPGDDGEPAAACQRLLSASSDKTVKLWEITAGGSKRRRTETTTTTAPEALASFDLNCRQTLRYAHGVSSISPTLLDNRYLLAGGGTHVPYLYFSDVVSGDHVAVVDLSAAGGASSSSSSSSWWSMMGSGSGGVLTSRVEAVAMHPFGAVAGLLGHTSTSSGGLGAALWSKSSGAPATTNAPTAGLGQSVVALWDVKSMTRDTVIPITCDIIRSAPGFASSTMPLAMQQEMASAVATSLAFAQDGVTFAVGLSSGAALVWDLRKVAKGPMGYLDAPPPHPERGVVSPGPASVSFVDALTTTVVAVGAGAWLSFYNVGVGAGLYRAGDGAVAQIHLEEEAGNKGGRSGASPLFITREVVLPRREVIAGKGAGRQWAVVGSYGGGVAVCQTAS